MLASISQLGKQYVSQDGSRVVALQDVSFDVGEGELITIVGPSGCGKSTLLHIMAGVLERSSGDIRLCGEPIAGPRRDVGVVFQEPLLLPWRTVLENLMLPVEVLGLDKEQYRRRADELIALTRLEGFAGKYPHELSGGMQQRVSIARALMHDPAILLMDEPFGALDAMTREQMNLDLLRIWSSSRKTVVLITHSIPEAVFLADRVIVMSARPGQIARIIDVTLPRPRAMAAMSDPLFGRLTGEIRELLYGRVTEGLGTGGGLS